MDEDGAAERSHRIDGGRELRISATSLRPHTTTSAPAARKPSAIPVRSPRSAGHHHDPAAEVERTRRGGEIECGHCCLPVSDWYCPDAVSDHAECVPAPPSAQRRVSQVAIRCRGRIRTTGAGHAHHNPSEGPRHCRSGHRPPSGQRPGRRRLVRPGCRGDRRRARPEQPGGDRPSRGSGGSCAGVDIKEIQVPGGRGPDRAPIGAVSVAFAAVYECEVPVIAAVHGFLPRRRGGNPWRQRWTSSWPPMTPRSGFSEVDRGCTRGGLTHPSRLVPQHLDALDGLHRSAGHRRRAAWATTAQCCRWCPPTPWSRRPTRWRRTLPPRVPPSSAGPRNPSTGSTPSTSRRATGSSRASPYELHVAGVADEQRAAFVEKRDAEPTA